MDQDETWRGGRPRLRPHCVRWGPSSPKMGHSPANFRPMSVVAKLLDGSRWYGARPWSRPHCVRCGPRPPERGTHPAKFLAHVCCGETAGWIKMPLGREVGLCPVNIVLDQLPPKGHSHPNFRPMSVVAKRLDGLRCHLVRRYALAQATLCYMGTQLPPKRHTSPNFQPMSIVAGQTVAHLSYC